MFANQPIPPNVCRRLECQNLILRIEEMGQILYQQLCSAPIGSTNLGGSQLQAVLHGLVRLINRRARPSMETQTQHNQTLVLKAAALANSPGLLAVCWILDEWHRSLVGQLSIMSFFETSTECNYPKAVFDTAQLIGVPWHQIHQSLSDQPFDLASCPQQQAMGQALIDNFSARSSCISPPPYQPLPRRSASIPPSRLQPLASRSASVPNVPQPSKPMEPMNKIQAFSVTSKKDADSSSAQLPFTFRSPTPQPPVPLSNKGLQLTEPGSAAEQLAPQKSIRAISTTPVLVALPGNKEDSCPRTPTPVASLSKFHAAPPADATVTTASKRVPTQLAEPGNQSLGANVVQNHLPPPTLTSMVSQAQKGPWASSLARFSSPNRKQAPAASAPSPSGSVVSPCFRQGTYDLSTTPPGFYLTYHGNDGSESTAPSPESRTVFFPSGPDGFASIAAEQAQLLAIDECALDGDIAAMFPRDSGNTTKGNIEAKRSLRVKKRPSPSDAMPPSKRSQGSRVQSEAEPARLESEIDEEMLQVSTHASSEKFKDPSTVAEGESQKEPAVSLQPPQASSGHSGTSSGDKDHRVESDRSSTDHSSHSRSKGPATAVQEKRARQLWLCHMKNFLYSAACNGNCSDGCPKTCLQTKALLRHVHKCEDMHCQFRGCYEARCMISHFNSCSIESCPKCCELRKYLTDRPNSLPSIREISESEHLLNLSRQRLLLVHHASNCTRKRCGYPVGIDKLPCAKAKQLVKHMITCRDRNCKVKFCADTKKTIFHYKGCKKEDCALCSLVREKVGPYPNPQGKLEKKQVEEANKTKSGLPTSQHPTVCPPTQGVVGQPRQTYKTSLPMKKRHLRTSRQP